MAYPLTAQILSNGRLRVQYGGTAFSMFSGNGDGTNGLHTIGGVSDAAATRFQFEDAPGVTPQHLSSNTITANSELRAGFLNNDAQIILFGASQTEDLEMSICAPSSVTGTGSNKIRLRRINIASPSSAQINPQFRDISPPIVHGWFDTDGGNGWLLPLTANAYTGPATDIALSGDPASPDIDTDSGSGSTTQVNFTFAMGRRAQLIGSASSAVLKVNGVSYNGSSVSISGGNTVFITFAVAVVPTDTVTLTLASGMFELSESSSSTTYTHENITSTDVPVTNNRNFIVPTWTGSAPTVSNAGTRIAIPFNTSLSSGSSSLSASITLNGNLQGNRVFDYMFTGAGNTAVFGLLSGEALIQNEVINGFNFPANTVRSSGSSGQANGVGENNSFTVSSFTVGSGGEFVLPPVLQLAPTISENGDSLTLFWLVPCSYNSGILTLTAEFSPNITSKISGGPDSGNGTNTWIYNLANPIRRNDNVSVNVPAGYAIEPEAYQTNVEENRSVTNNSNIAYPKPTLISGLVEASGQAVTLTFGEDVALNSDVLEERVKVIAEDTSSSEQRTFTATPGSGAISGGTQLQFDIEGAGTIFGTDLPMAGDGDEVRAHSSGFSGLVSTQLSEDAGEPALLDPFGDEITFSSSYLLTNNSTQPEPASSVIPNYVSVTLFNQGDNPIEQFLDIVFDDGSSSAIGVQRSTAFPTLSGAVTGEAILEFVEIRNTFGENDTIRFKVTSNQFVRESDGDILTFSLPVDVVVSDNTGDSNLAVGPFVSNVESTFSNNSTIILPEEPQTPPVIEQVIVGVDGKLIGIYYDVSVFKVGGDLVVDGLLTGSRAAPFSDIPDPDEDTLVTFTLGTTLPIFKGEAVFIDAPAALVANTQNGQQSLAVSQIRAINNSIEPAPVPPVLDASTLNSPGTVVQLTFSVPVLAGTGSAYVISSLSGRHNLTIESISSTIVSASVSGIIFANETVELFIERDFIKEALHNFRGNLALNNFVVDVSGRSGAPALPVNATDLNSEAAS